MNAIEHLRRTEALRNTPYIRRNGKGYRLVNGNLIPEAEFQDANKLPVRLHTVSYTHLRAHETN